VFEWLVDPAMLSQWWPSEAETDPVVGASYRMYWSGPDVTLRGRYLAVEPGVRVAFTWSWDHDDIPPRTVVVELRPEGDGTLARVSHEAESDDEVGDYRDGWTYCLRRLDERLRGG
jgi:uncharacterized protein YndB with AHSA1/START domain